MFYFSSLPRVEMHTFSMHSSKRSNIASPVPEALAAPLSSFLARPSVIIAMHSLLSLASVEELRHIEVLRARRAYESIRIAHSRYGSPPLSRGSHVNSGDSLNLRRNTTPPTRQLDIDT